MYWLASKGRQAQSNQTNTHVNIQCESSFSIKWKYERNSVLMSDKISFALCFVYIIRKMGRIHFYRTHKYSSSCWRFLFLLLLMLSDPPIGYSTNNNSLKHLTAIHNGTYTKDSRIWHCADCRLLWTRIISNGFCCSKMAHCFFIFNGKNITEQKRLIYDRYSIMKSINRRVLYIHAQKKRIISIFRELVPPPLQRQ